MHYVSSTIPSHDIALALRELLAPPPEQPAVLLVSMPWRASDCPNLALGVLKPIIAHAGVHCNVLEAGLISSTLCPAPLYDALGRDPSGELAFAPHAYENYEPARARGSLREAFGRIESPEGSLDAGTGIELAGLLLDLLEVAVPWERYQVVGLSLTFQQTLASVALARRLKRTHPHLRTIVGGSCCDGPMGAALLEEFDCLDFAVAGRAEATIEKVVDAALGEGAPASIAGLAHRCHGTVVANPQEAMRVPLGELPFPDYDDYFALRRNLGLLHQGLRVLLETSVGCWWGQKHLCSFCGLNATSLSYRQKEGKRVLEEIRTLSQKYLVESFELTDNILPRSFFQDLLPTLANANESFTFFAEVKSNVKKGQLQLLRKAGFRCLQPGIESFDDHILELMDKGCTGIGQVQFIKWCDELGIDVGYSMLVGNLGERAEDYERMLEWLPSLVHLSPPYSGPVRIQLARFSPYFENPSAFGIDGITPTQTFRRIFPQAPPERLARLAYFFDFRAQGLDTPQLDEVRRRFERGILRWRAVHARELLTYRSGNGWVRITDARGPALEAGRPVRRILLREDQARIFLACDRVQSLRQLAIRFPQVPAQDLRNFVERLVRLRVAISDGTRILALPINARRSDYRHAESLQPNSGKEQPGEAAVVTRRGFRDEALAFERPSSGRHLRVVGRNDAVAKGPAE